MRALAVLSISALLFLTACQQADAPPPADAVGEPEVAVLEVAVEPAIEQPSRFDMYATVRLTADLGHLTDRQKQMIPLLIQASKIMDDLYWLQAYGDRKPLLDRNVGQRGEDGVDFGR